jgi:hypothetical protein
MPFIPPPPIDPDLSWKVHAITERCRIAREKGYDQYAVIHKPTLQILKQRARRRS